MQIRQLKVEDLPEVRRIYQAAFAGFPWFESLKDADLDQRVVEKDFQPPKIKGESGREYSVPYPRYQGLVAIQDSVVAGAVWWEIIGIDELRAERGEELANFAQRFPREYLRYVWEREVIVSPSHQGRGIGLALRQEAIKVIETDYRPVIILTRMRDDNVPIIRIAERCGFLRTKIKVSSSQVPGLNHEYWYYEEYFSWLLGGR